MRKLVLWGLFLFTGLFARGASVDMLIFSYNRPLQLHALLESIDHYTQNLGNIFILYRASNADFQTAYEECFNAFKHLPLHFSKQSNRAEQEFKPRVMGILTKSKASYMLFAVDDDLIIDTIDFDHCIKLLTQTSAYGFYLRMGKDITHSYTQNRPCPVPRHTSISSDSIAWQFSHGRIEWAYPTSLDMTICKRTTIIETFSKLQFKTPNQLEAQWNIASRYTNLHKQNGLCYTQSKSINIPFNLVQSDYPNARNMNLSVNDLLQVFNNGQRIDVSAYHQTPHLAPHIELPLHLHTPLHDEL